jgi:hypothetical protein
MNYAGSLAIINRICNYKDNLKWRGVFYLPSLQTIQIKFFIDKETGNKSMACSDWELLDKHFRRGVFWKELGLPHLLGKYHLFVNAGEVMEVDMGKWHIYR